MAHKGRPVRALLQLAQPGARLIEALITDEEQEECWYAYILCGKKCTHVSAATIEMLDQREWVSAPQMSDDGTLTERLLTSSGSAVAEEIIECQSQFEQLALWGGDEFGEEEATQQPLFSERM